MSRVRIGVSGWNYDGWRGDFYPADLPAKEWLEHASERLATLEINGTFYSLQSPKSFREWREATPRGFRFAVKGSRFITHSKRLKECETPLANFFASGLLELREKLGPLLWQLPARARFDASRLESFLQLLPRDTEQASRLARRHDDRVDEVSLKVDRKRRLHHALEVRHESFLQPEALGLLRRHGVALAFSDGAGEWPYAEDLTAGFAYVRLHGPEDLYAGAYGRRRLRRWAKKIRAWHEGTQPRNARLHDDREPPRRKSRDVWVYFDNDEKGHAPHDAMTLRELLDE